jgi:hypothetical protein
VFINSDIQSTWNRPAVQLNRLHQKPDIVVIFDIFLFQIGGTAQVLLRAMNIHVLLLSAILSISLCYGSVTNDQLKSKSDFPLF